MDTFTTKHLETLCSVGRTSCVSIYMPTFKAGMELQQNPLRFKNLISEAHNKLIDFGMRPTKANQLLQEAKQILENGTFWQHLSDGLAFFVSPQMSQLFRLPEHFDELTHVGEKFHVKPLISMLTGDTTFYLLVLDLKGVRLYKGSRHFINRIHSDILPKGMNETLGFDTEEKNVQFSRSRPDTGAGSPPTVFGYGRQTDKEKVNTLNYYHRVNDAVATILNRSTSPLITMGEEYQNALYTHANTYPQLLQKSISKNAEHLPESQLHTLAWQVAMPHFQGTENRLFHHFKQLRNENSPMAVEDLITIITGALQGRVETLFLLNGQTHLWGKLKNTPAPEIELHENQLPGDEDLLEAAALNTIFKGGIVFMIKPEQVIAPSPVAAILRF